MIFTRAAALPSQLVVVGAGSFIAQHVIAAGRLAGLKVTAIPHYGLADLTIAPTDMLINFGLAPAYSRAAYDVQNDCDFRVAQAAAAAGARFCLLSTRRVYGPQQRWGGQETAAVEGDETVYGRNKAHTEKCVQELVPNALILRMSNVFGFEFGSQLRTSFVGRLLSTLKMQDSVFFDMAATTRRDFFPVEACAAGIIEVVRSGASGIFNLGSGFPLACGELAGWIMTGYGSGKLVITSESLSDEFYLDMTKWNARFPRIAQMPDLRPYCIELGQRLRGA